MQETAVTILQRAGRATEISIKQGLSYNLYRGQPTLRAPGSKPCGCGRKISANRKACRECASVPFLDMLA